MKFVHLADLHIGKRVCEFSMIEDQRHILRQAVDIAKGAGASAVLLCGDIYDRSTPGADAVALADRFLSACAEEGLAVVGISGNHDSAERVAYGRDLLARQGVHLSPVFNGTVEHCVLYDEHGPVAFWMMPFVRPSTVRPFFPERQIDSHDEAVRCVLDTVRASADYDPEGRNVLLAHQFVTWSGTQTELGGSELQLGTLDNVDAGAFEGFSYVALGHVHRPQRVMLDTIRYSGSPLKYSASEARYDKTLPVVEIDEFDNVTISLEKLTPLHDVREIRGSVEDLLCEQTRLAADQNDYIFAVVTDEQPRLGFREQLRDAYPNLMNITLQPKGTSSASRPSQAQPAIKSPLELFAEFFEEMNETPLNENQRRLVEKTLAEVEAL